VVANGKVAAGDDELRYFLDGEFDRAEADELGADLVTAAAQHSLNVTIDCRHLSFIDLACVSALDAARHHIEAQGGNVRFVNLSPFHADLFALFDSTPGGVVELSRHRVVPRRRPDPPSCRQPRWAT
jgi:anti-anti-sigma factor